MTMKNHSQWRREKRTCILHTLRESGRPMSLGDLFLATKLSHTALRDFLTELKEANLIESKIMTTESKTYTGTTVKREALHWSLVKNPSY